MWLLRSTHKHINQETLNEYLDGRLRGKDLERVEQRLADCDACRLELEELQATVAIMRQLPLETPRRSFVMSAPPPEPARSRPALALRAPNWVYAGAASVAALALAVTISVDATGGLSSDPLRRDAAVTAPVPAATAEAVTAASGAAESAPASTSVPDDDSRSARSMAISHFLSLHQLSLGVLLARPQLNIYKFAAWKLTIRTLSRHHLIHEFPKILQLRQRGIHP